MTTEINDESNKINSFIFREQLFWFADKTNLSQVICKFEL